ncbi:cysteine peptidase family C39 domain-containing protein [Mesoflavibacter zeaxanthinifaciens]
MKKLPFYKQTEAKECGPTCLKIIAKYFVLAKKYSLARNRHKL